MDPLSICAGVIAVIQAANGIVNLCYDYRAALKEQPWALSQILNHVQDLRNTLERVEEVVSKARTTSKGREQFVSILSETKESPLRLCEEELGRLGALLAPSSLAGRLGTHRNAAVTAFTWKIKDKDARACLERIERIKSTLSLALHSTEATILLDMQQSIEDTNQTLGNVDLSLQEMKHRIEEDHDAKLDEERQRLLNALCPIDPVRRQSSILQKCAYQSTEWLLQSATYKRFKDGTTSALWISGPPGSGKTVVFASVVNDLAQLAAEDDTMLVAHFYCDFRNEKLCNPESAIAALIGQLCKSTNIIPVQLEQTLCANNGSFTSDVIHLDMLRELFAFFTTMYTVTILLDAVDECEDSARLASFINALLPLNLKILITSREVPKLQVHFASFDRLKFSDFVSDIDHSLRQYIQSRLSNDSDLCALDPQVKTDIKDALRAQAAGMFRWVSCQLDSIAELRTVKQIRDALKTLPRGLDETYAAILCKVQARDREFVRKALLWLAFAMLPLTLNELREAIAVDFSRNTLDDEERLNNAEDILTLCGSLASINSTGTVCLAHMSVKDYLLSDQIRNDVRTASFAFSKEEAHLELARTCLAYLRFNEFQSGPSTSVEAYIVRLSRCPLTKHVAIAWPYHLRHTSSNDAYYFEFFLPEQRMAFMSWVQVLNADCNFKWNIYPKHATSLYYAASFGLDSIVRRLLETDVDINAVGSRLGGTAMHGATFRKLDSTMRLLLDAGADVNKCDLLLTSPLHIAIAGQDLRIVALLLEHGASLTTKDLKGRTPLDWSNIALPAWASDLLKQIAEAAPYPTVDLIFKTSPSIANVLQIWQRPTTELFCFFEERSGVNSSIVVGIETGPMTARLV